nr:MAG: hypothetical protein [Apis mellifera filamentous virus]
MMAMMAMMATTESPMVASTLVHHESKSHAQTRAKNSTEFTEIAFLHLSALVASVDEQH